MEDENKTMNESPDTAEKAVDEVSAEESTNTSNDKQENSASQEVNKPAENVTTETASPIEDILKKKRGKIPLIVGVVVAILAIGAAVFFFVIKHGIGGGSQEVNRAIWARYDTDGIAYVPLMDGTVAKIDDNVLCSCVTPDRKHVVTLTADKLIYFTDADQAKKTQVTDNGYIMRYLENEGIIYSDYEGDFHRYLFSDGSDVNLGKVDSSIVSESNFNIAYAEDSSVYLLAGNSREKEKIGNLTNDCEFLYISDDAKTIYWNDNKDYVETIYIYANGEKSKIGTFETSSTFPRTYVNHNKNKKYAVITNSDSDMLFVVTNNGEPLKVKLGDKLASSIVYTSSGLLDKDTSSEFKGIYVSTGDEFSSLYYIDSNGEREKVLSRNRFYAICDGYLFYVDIDNNFKNAKLTAAFISDEEKVTDDVEIVNSTIINGYIFFAKDYNSEERTGTLYAYKRGSDPIKVASDVNCYVGSWRYISGGTSVDGKSIYFLKDPTYIKDSHVTYGVLYKYTYGDSVPTKIASDVVEGTLESDYVSELINNKLINNKSFTYFKYSAVKNNRIVGDWYYYNGTDSVKMAEHLFR